VSAKLGINGLSVGSPLGSTFHPTSTRSTGEGERGQQPREEEGPVFYRPGDVVVGRYHVLETIGAGPLGVVYRAENRVNGVAVALRVIWPDLLPDDAARGRFLKLTTRARSVSNRYIVPLVEVLIDEVGGQAVCVMAVKHVAGPTLASRLARRLRHGVPLLAVEAQPIVSQIGVGLSAIHARGLAHGNLHLGNVFLVGEEARLSDLGVASALPPSTVAMAERHAGRSRHRAPEVAAGRACSPSGDVYALAVLTGQMLGLFVKKSVRVDAPVPSSVRAVLRKALSPSPADRYADVDSFAGALVTAFERADQRAAIGLRAVEAGEEKRDAAAAGNYQAPVAGALEISPGAMRAMRHRRGAVAASVVVDEDAFALRDGADARTPVTAPPLPPAEAAQVPTPEPAAASARVPTAPFAPVRVPTAPFAPVRVPTAPFVAGRLPVPFHSPVAAAFHQPPSTAVPLPGLPPARLPAVPPAPSSGRRGATADARRPELTRDTAVQLRNARVPAPLLVVLATSAAFLGGSIVRNLIVAHHEEQVARARVEKAEMLRRAMKPPAPPTGAAPAGDPSPPTTSSSR
jgi:hypothetical protein